jgi:hypothetical protein
MLGSLVPFTAFTFVDEQYRLVIGTIALLMVLTSLVMLSRR